MENLKIKFYLDSPFIADRFLTISSILLKVWFEEKKRNGEIPKNDFVEVEDYLDEISSFLAVENGVVSGSIWYVPIERFLKIENVIFIKSINNKKFYEYTGKKNINKGSGEFKAYRFGYEAIITPYVYFYVTGDKRIILKLLDNVKYIGKKNVAGYGKIKKIEIESALTDKSFMINDYTASKPLPCNDFNLKTKRVAFFRKNPPYWDNKDLVPCYMPPTSLVETIDKTVIEKFDSFCDFNYVSPTEFAVNALKKQKLDCDISKFVKKGIKKIYSNDSAHCVLCGVIKKNGLKGSIKKILPVTFNDFAFIKKGNFICTDCLCSMLYERTLGNTFIDSDGKVIYLQGSKMTIDKNNQKEFRRDFFLNLEKQNPPFLISLKSTSNTQHTVFKSRVAISNAFVPLSFGDSFGFLDISLLKDAYYDAMRILNDNKCIKKLHLCNFDKNDDNFPTLSKKCTDTDKQIIENFYKHYDKTIRRVLSKIL